MSNKLLTIYAIQNFEGKYFKSRGLNTYNRTRWVNELKNAKIYLKIGNARKVCTYYANTFPEHGIPSLVELNISEIKIINETDRINKAIALKTEKDRENEIHRIEREIIYEQHFEIKNQEKLHNLNEQLKKLKCI